MVRARAITFVAEDVREVFFGPTQRCATGMTVTTLDEIENALAALDGGEAGTQATLDLVGHSTRDHKFLRIGTTAINAMDESVSRFFTSLQQCGVLDRLRVSAVRLLGCETATRAAGQLTIVRISRMVGRPVFGVSKQLFKSHFDPDGLKPAFAGILVSSEQLARGTQLTGQARSRSGFQG